MASVDPITYEVLRARLDGIVREMEKAEERIHVYADEGSLSKAMNLGIEEDEDEIARIVRAKQVEDRERHWKEVRAADTGKRVGLVPRSDDAAGDDEAEGGDDEDGEDL